MNRITGRKHKSRPRISLKLKLIVVFTVLYAALMAVFVYLDLEGVHTLIEQEMRSTSLTFAKTLTVAATSAISTGELGFLNEYIANAEAIPNVKKITVLDSAGKVIISRELRTEPEGGQNITGEASRIEESILEEIGTPPRDLLHNSGHAFRATIPIVVEGEQRGAVQVETFSRELNEKITDLGRRWIFFTLMATAIGGLVAVIMAWGMTKELTKLAEGSKKIAGGDLSHRVNIKTNDELKDVGDAFNTMASELMRSYSDLEMQVKERTEELQESNRKLESLFDGITDIISVQDTDFNIVMANNAASGMVNLSPHHVIGRKCYEVYCKRGEICANCPVKETIETGMPATADEERSGEILRLYTYPINDDKGRLTSVIEFGKLITKEKRLEEQLIRSAKLASLGELASTIAHEIRNPLAGIKTGAQFIEKHLPDAASSREVLSMILRETNRLEEVVASFLSFARPPRPSFRPINIRQSMENAIAVAEEKIREQKVKIVREYGTVPDVVADGEQMQQVFLNIIINAIQAMEGGGVLTFKTAVEKGRARIEISDTGAGVPLQALGHIFDPFFTTKSQGTGLGLSISKRIVEENKGTITMESTEGKGTILRIELPV
jgi:nitrogen fixation/metabolism regulation signal transduction histidine kinase